jgi:hypothetical protein
MKEKYESKISLTILYTFERRNGQIIILIHLHVLHS